MGTARSRQTAVLLTNGWILVIGGETDKPAYLTNTCEMFEPATMTWTNTGAMSVNRYIPSATVLRDGRVLVAGGTLSPPNSCEIFDPATGSWSLTGTNFFTRTNHGAVLLPDGRVLVAGGTQNTNTEIFDPKSGTWKLTGALQRSRKLLSMSLLPDGKVLVAGGYYSGTTNSSAEIYNPINGTWSYTGSMTTSGVGGDDSSSFALMNLLPNGTVLAMAPPYNTEIYYPSSGGWTNAGFINTNHIYSKSVLLKNGKVLFVSGYLTSNSELFGSTNAPTKSFSQIYSDRQADASMLVSFASTPNGTNVVLASTNCALPKTSWSNLGLASEIAPGLYRFTDSTPTNFLQRFYRIRSP
jgi:N-acetylneuraminic acid mutarotase